MIHKDESPLAGKEVKISDDANKLGGHTIRIEDWWDRIAGKSWGMCDGNPACMIYAMRTGTSEKPVPIDDEVLYGKIGGLGYLVHVSELGEIQST